MSSRFQSHAAKGSAMILTLMMLVLLSLQVAIISMVAVRGVGDNALLSSQNVSAKQASESALGQLVNTIHNQLMSFDPSTVATMYSKDNVPPPAVLNAVNPDSGASEPTPITTSAWIQERRGDYYLVVGLARSGGVEMLTSRWVYINPCSATGKLLTIASGLNRPGERGTQVAPDGRVYFADVGNPNKVYTWHQATGLSVILSGQNHAGHWESMLVDRSGRLYIAQSNSPGPFWTWSPSTGLSTIIASSGAPGKEGMRLSPVDDRLYIGGWGEYFWTWKNGVLSTLVDTSAYWGNVGGGGTTAVAPDGRIYFAEDRNPGKVWTWKEGVGLSTIATHANNLNRPGYYWAMTGGSNWAYFGTWNGQAWAWKDNGTPQGVLSMLLSGGKQVGTMGIAMDHHTGRVYIGEHDHATNNGFSNSRLWSWKEGAGLTTLLTNSRAPGVWYMLEMAPDGRAYFGSWDAETLWSYKDGVGLSTIINSPGAWSIGREAMKIAPDGSLFAGHWSGDTDGLLWRWKEGVGVSTIIGGSASPGVGNLQIAPNGRIFFSEYKSGNQPNRYYTWKQDTGLSIIMNNAYDPYFTSVASPKGDLYFGEARTNGNFYMWKSPDCGL